MPTQLALRDLPRIFLRSFGTNQYVKDGHQFSSTLNLPKALHYNNLLPN